MEDTELLERGHECGCGCGSDCKSMEVKDETQIFPMDDDIIQDEVNDDMHILPDFYLEVKFQTLSALNRELIALSSMSLTCRQQIFDLIQKDSEKIKDKLDRLHTFLESLDTRYNDLFTKIGHLLRGDSDV